MTPGNTYVLTLKNLLPYVTPSTIENDFKDPNITNIHTHGLHVSPTSPSDDVLRLINGTYCGDYVYAVPATWEAHCGTTRTITARPIFRCPAARWVFSW